MGMHMTISIYYYTLYYTVHSIITVYYFYPYTVYKTNTVILRHLLLYYTIIYIYIYIYIYTNIL